MTIAQPPRPPAPVMSADEFALAFGPWASWIETAAKVIVSALRLRWQDAKCVAHGRIQAFLYWRVFWRVNPLNGNKYK
ncbi:hypothetical protein [Paracoccus lutimaris]|uniref:hypothetical protein n=1 Tax=Paracoccus lutimaris TaxID=1490030 RepID=UPI0011C04D90|nr:hypothetical protein [Paracoccus lutimaris]